MDSKYRFGFLHTFWRTGEKPKQMISRFKNNNFYARVSISIFYINKFCFFFAVCAECIKQMPTILMWHKSRVFSASVHAFNLCITSFYFETRWAYKIFIVGMWQHVKNVSEISSFFHQPSPQRRDAVSTLSVRHLHRLIKCDAKRDVKEEEIRRGLALIPQHQFLSLSPAYTQSTP